VTFVRTFVALLLIGHPLLVAALHWGASDASERSALCRAAAAA
jgi:hypothetical protein